MSIRWPFYASVATLAFAGAACAVGGLYEWSQQDAAAMGQVEAAEQARFATELLAIGGLNLLVAIAFTLLPRSRAFWLALGVQVAAIVLAIVETALTGDGPGWLTFSALPVVTAFVLVSARLRITPAASAVPAAGTSPRSL